MIMRKETLVFLTSLAIIFIIGYVNMTLVPENSFNEEDYAQLEEANSGMEEDLAQILEGEQEDSAGLQLVEVLEQTDTTDIAVSASAGAEQEAAVTGKSGEEPAAETSAEPQDVAQEEVAGEEVAQKVEDDIELAETVEEEEVGIVLGDITNILDKDSVVASSNGVFDMLNSSFSNFALNKEKGNQDVLDHLEKSMSSEALSADAKKQFEDLLLNKNEYIETEKKIELLLQTKGYKQSLVIVDSDMIKVVSNDTIEQADATRILDVIVSETNFEPSQVKIVKFDNIDL